MYTPEQRARQLIDLQLAAAGWVVQDAAQLSLGAAGGVAVREFPTESGPADYALFVDKTLVGIVEAKREGTSLTAVAEQTARYQTSGTKFVRRAGVVLPFGYEANGTEVRFSDTRDPAPRSRAVFGFHRPETLRKWLAEATSTLRRRLQHLPALATAGLRECQVEAVQNLEESLRLDRPRALIQMATGAGKTFTAVTFAYRLLKFAKARRVLFLVDRGNLGRQALLEFQQYATPDDGRKFTELYNVQHLTSNRVDDVSKVTITTIQRLYSMLRGEVEYDAGNEEQSGFEHEMATAAVRPREVAYNAALPPETYDFVVIDECHRSIYNVWQQVLEYFDAHLIGLTATPAKQTFGFFNRNLVMEYSHARAVVDGVNVGSDVYHIGTRISLAGSTVGKGERVQHVERQTRRRRWEALEEELPYAATQLDRSVTAPDQIRTIIREWKRVLFTELFPGRSLVPKTLIFAKTDQHADDIVAIVREEFGKGNDFCKKITYGTTGEKAEDLIKRFRNSYDPRVAVTVDMISTGTDIRPLECLVFLRDVRSRVYFDQMKGRGTRTMQPGDLQLVTEDAPAKTRFVVVDAVGVTESVKRDPLSTERTKGLSFENLLNAVALGSTDAEHLRGLAGRLARLGQQLAPEEQAAVARQAGGQPLRTLAGQLFDAVDPVKVEAVARALVTAPAAEAVPDPLSAALLAGEVGTDTAPAGEPTEAHYQQAEEQLAARAVAAFDAPALRALLVKLHQQKDLVIDHISLDEVVRTQYGERFSAEDAAAALARQQVGRFRAFLEAHKDEILALQVLHNQPWRQRGITYRQLRELAEALKLESPDLTPAHLWAAYERLEARRVRAGAGKAGSTALLTNLISLVRFALNQTDELTPYPLTVAERYGQWLTRQQLAGRLFSEEQLRWLALMRDHIASSLSVETEDFGYAPFEDYGGYGRAWALFGDALAGVVQELNEALAA